MYELSEHHPEVAEQIAGLPRRAVADDDAAVYILCHPYDGDLVSRGPGQRARRRSFGLDRGTILYTPDGDTRTVSFDLVSLLR